MSYKIKSPIPIIEGGTGVATLVTAYAPVISGTTATAPLQVASTGLGTAGFVLTSTGASSLPTFQATSLSGAVQTVTGDTGGALTGSNITFAGGTTGLAFGGSGTTETLTFAGITANGGTVSLATDATASAINVGTGAGVKTTIIGSVNTTSPTTVQSGSGALNVTATGGALTINSGVGALAISNDSSATTLTIGTGNAVKTVTLGSTNTSSTTTLTAGSGGVVLGTSGAAGVIVASSTQVLSSVTGTAGLVLTANAAGTAPSFQSIPFQFTWSVITADQTAVVNNGYIANKAGTLALLLPATAAIGDTIRVIGINTATGWQITQSANQQIFIGTSSTTLGVTGTVTSINIRDSIEIVCVVAGASTVWNCVSLVGNVTIV